MEYIAAQPKAALDCVRRAIRKAVPGAVELISYKMPTYKLQDNPVLYFAAWKRHYSLYAATKRVVASFKGELVPYKANKGTISFPLSDPVLLKLIERIAKLRAKRSCRAREGEGGRAEDALDLRSGSGVLLDHALVFTDTVSLGRKVVPAFRTSASSQ